MKEVKWTELIDLKASQPIDTTISQVDQEDPQWVEKAARVTNAASGDDYVKLDRGVLTVNQIDAMLTNLPMELTTCDSNNQYLYYNYHKEQSEMMAPRNPESVGKSLASCHPARISENVAKLIYKMTTHEEPKVIIKSPYKKTDNTYVLHVHQAFYEKDGEYVGTMEWVRDIKQYVDYYCMMTGQKVVEDPNAKFDHKEVIDTVSTASQEKED